MSTQPVDTAAPAAPQAQDPAWVQEGMRNAAAAQEPQHAADAPDDNDEDDSQEDSSSEPFDERRALAKIRKSNREARSQRERAEAAERQAATVPDLQRANGDLEARVMRLDVAIDLGLPKELASRLTGSTREEVLADAEALLKYLGTRRPPSPRPVERAGVTGDGEPLSTDSMKDIGARMFGR